LRFSGDDDHVGSLGMSRGLLGGGHFGLLLGLLNLQAAETLLSKALAEVVVR
jgi:hypothetical protein